MMARISNTPLNPIIRRSFRSDAYIFVAYRAKPARARRAIDERPAVARSEHKRPEVSAGEAPLTAGRTHACRKRRRHQRHADHGKSSPAQLRSTEARDRAVARPWRTRRAIHTTSVNRSKASGQGLEPRLPDPESGVLPLDDPATGRTV